MNLIREAQLKLYDNAYNMNNLSLRELLYFIVGNANGKREHIVNEILRLHDTVGLENVEYYDLLNINGVGMAMAQRLTAAFELGFQIEKQKRYKKGYYIISPEDAYQYVKDYSRYKQEYFIVLALDTKNQVILKKETFVGSLNASIVHPREVFKDAIRVSAASIIVAHNHPSGDPTPSPEDTQVTKRLVESGKVLGIEVLDHIVIGLNRFVSLKEKGYL